MNRPGLFTLVCGVISAINAAARERCVEGAHNISEATIKSAVKHLPFTQAAPWVMNAEAVMMPGYEDRMAIVDLPDGKQAIAVNVGGLKYFIEPFACDSKIPAMTIHITDKLSDVTDSDANVRTADVFVSSDGVHGT